MHCEVARKQAGAERQPDWRPIRDAAAVVRREPHSQAIVEFVSSLLRTGRVRVQQTNQPCTWSDGCVQIVVPQCTALGDERRWRLHVELWRAMLANIVMKVVPQSSGQ